MFDVISAVWLVAGLVGDWPIGGLCSRLVAASTTAVTADDFPGLYAKTIRINDQLQAIITESQKQVSPDRLKELSSLTRPLARELGSLEPKLVSAAELAWQRSPSPEALEVLQTRIGFAFEGQRYGVAARLCGVLLTHRDDLAAFEQDILRLATISAFGSNEFDVAERRLKSWKEKWVLDTTMSMYAENIRQYKTFWAAEQAARGQHDLPHLALETSAGAVVFELFGNEAPLAAQKIIQLAQEGQFNGLHLIRIPHRSVQKVDVLKHQASAELESLIEEGRRKDRRNLFRGSLCIGAVDDGAKREVFIASMPLPELNRKCTVIGRMIDGFDKYDKMNKPDAAEKTQIKRAVVLGNQERSEKSSVEK